MWHVSFKRFRLRFAVFTLASWALATSVAAAPFEEAYTVRRGDTLWSIARANGIPVSRLAERNGLSRNYYVYAGQRLILPAKSSRETTLKPASPPPKSPLPALPSRVQRAIDRAEVKPGRWQRIVIHHSGVDTGTVKAMDRYHREARHMENGLAYHFVIGNGDGMGDGEIAVGSRWTRQLDGGHLSSESQNKFSLGICLVGNFETHGPTPRQMQRLTALVRALMIRCRISPDKVMTHQQINVVYTRCPGRYFPTESFLSSLKPPP